MSKAAYLSIVACVIFAAIDCSADEVPRVVHLTDDELDRVPLHTVVPKYPENARRDRVEGEVQVCFNVNRKGKTFRLAVRKSTHRVFEKPSIKAVRKSTYRPLAKNQVLSGIKTCRTFRFLLEPVAIDQLNGATDEPD